MVQALHPGMIGPRQRHSFGRWVGAFARLVLATGFVICALANGALAQTAPAQTLPAMSFLTAPLVSPTTAQAFYGSATTHTNSLAASVNAGAFAGRAPEIVELARSLKNNPDLINEYIQNEIEVEFAFGVRKGALGTLIDRSGTPFDQNVLFVQTVRQAGFNAQYVIAPVTFTAAAFASWTGVSDIQAACRLLSSGGIPAAFNGASSSTANCAQIGTGAFTSVTLLHIYSQVQINGVWYAYDPSFKAHTVAAGINLVTASGLVSGQAATAAGQTLSSGSSGGATFIKNASSTALNSYLTTVGTKLLSYISANAPATDMDGLVGITKIVPAYAPSGGWRNTAPTGYAVGSGAVTITGDIPDQYRTKLSINLFTNSTEPNPKSFNL